MNIEQLSETFWDAYRDSVRLSWSHVNQFHANSIRRGVQAVVDAIAQQDREIRAELDRVQSEDLGARVARLEARIAVIEERAA